MQERPFQISASEYKFCRKRGKDDLMDSFLCLFGKMELYSHFKEAYNSESMSQLPSLNSMFILFDKLLDLGKDIPHPKKASGIQIMSIVDYVRQFSDSSTNFITLFLQVLSSVFKMEKILKYMCINREDGFTIEMEAENMLSEDDLKQEILKNLEKLLSLSLERFLERVPFEFYIVAVQTLDLYEKLNRQQDNALCALYDLTKEEKIIIYKELVSRKEEIMKFEDGNMSEVGREFLNNTKNLICTEAFQRDTTGSYSQYPDIVRFFQSIIRFQLKFWGFFYADHSDNLSQVFQEIIARRSDAGLDTRYFMEAKSSKSEVSFTLDRYYLKGSEAINVLESSIQFYSNSPALTSFFSVYKGNKHIWSRGYDKMQFTLKVVTELVPDQKYFKGKTQTKFVRIHMPDIMSQLQTEFIGYGSSDAKDFSCICIFETNSMYFYCVHDALESEQQSVDLAEVCKRGKDNLSFISVYSTCKISEYEIKVIFMGGKSSNNWVLYLGMAGSTIGDLANYLLEYYFSDDKKIPRFSLIEALIFSPINNFLNIIECENMVKTLSALDSQFNGRENIPLESIAMVYSTKTETGSPTQVLPANCKRISLLCGLYKLDSTYSTVSKMRIVDRKVEIRVRPSASEILEFAMQFDNNKKLGPGINKPAEAQLSSNHSNPLKSIISSPEALQRDLRQIEYFLPKYYLVNVEKWNSEISLLSDFTLNSKKDFIRTHKECFYNYSYEVKAFILKRPKESSNQSKISLQDADCTFEPVEVHSNTLEELAKDFPVLFEAERSFCGLKSTKETVSTCEEEKFRRCTRLRWYKPGALVTTSQSSKDNLIPEKKCYDILLRDFKDLTKVAWIIYESKPCDFKDIVCSYEDY